MYAVHHQYRKLRAFGYEETRVEGGVEHPDGRVERFATLQPELRFDPENRRVLGGTLHFGMDDGSARPVTVEAIGDTGFHLGAGLYFGLDGHHHGEWRGKLHVDGEHIADCTTPETRGASIRSATRSCGSTIRSVVVGVGATSRRRSWGSGPTTGLDEASSFV